MTTKKHKGQPTSDNERTSVNSLRHPEVVRGDQPATPGKRGEASRIGLTHPARTPMPRALRGGNPLGLGHPARTPPPPELGFTSRGPTTTGARRVASETSAYAARAERRGELAGVIAFLHQVRRGVAVGGTLLEAVGDGTLLGWRVREALNSVLDEPLANWDRRTGRTQLERRAVVERVLAELGVEAHRGGWSVSR